MEDINEEGKYKITYTSQFKKDYKKYKGNKTKILKVVETISLLEEGGVDKLPKSMKAHFLTGNYRGHLECHIEPDLLIIWLQYDIEEQRILLVRLGSHSELFGK